MNKWTIPITLSLILHVSGFYFLQKEKVRPLAIKKDISLNMYLIHPSNIIDSATKKIEKSTFSEKTITNNEKKPMIGKDFIPVQDIKNNLLDNVEKQNIASDVIAEKPKLYISYGRTDVIKSYKEKMLYGDKLLELLRLIKDEQSRFVFEIFIDKDYKVYDIKNIENTLPEPAVSYLKTLLFMMTDVSIIFDVNSGDYYEEICNIDIDLDPLCNEYVRQRNEYTQQNASAGVGSVPN